MVDGGGGVGAVGAQENRGGDGQEAEGGKQRSGLQGSKRCGKREK